MKDILLMSHDDLKMKTPDENGNISRNDNTIYLHFISINLGQPIFCHPPQKAKGIFFFSFEQHSCRCFAPIMM